MWESWPQREVYAHPSYVKLYTDDTSCALCVSYQSSEGNVLYPFILRDLTAEPFWSPGIGPAADIITPYGYGGPFVWGHQDSECVADLFWPQFGEWAIQRTIVSEFVRFTLFPQTVLQYPGQKEEKLQNIVRTLDLDQNELLMDFKHKVRKNVKKAVRSGVEIEVDPDGRRLDEFLRIYRHTMDRRGASRTYYFPRDYFERLQRELAGQFCYFHALDRGEPVSTELVLMSAENVYSFLGGSYDHASDLRPNDLLKYEIILWAKNQNKRRFVLGGGYRPGDGIYRYKHAFAPNGCVPFYVGWRVFRGDLYDQFVHNRRALARAQENEWTPQPGFFPAYRA